MAAGTPGDTPCATPQTPAGPPSTAGCSSATSAAACTAAWAATSPSSSTCATAPGPPPCSRWVPAPRGHGGTPTGTPPPHAHRALPFPRRWCTPWPATGPTPSGSTRCWIRRRCRAGAGRQTPRIKCSKCRGEGGSAPTGCPPPPLTPQPAVHPPPAPPSRSSSAPSTRCWPSSTSCPAGTTTASLPRTSARWGGGVGSPPLGGGDRSPS